MNPRLRDECLCGDCGPCRRSLKELAYVPPTPVTLSPKAREILAEPVGTPYRPPSHQGRGGVIPRAVIDRRPDGHVKQIRKRPVYTPPIDPADRERKNAISRAWRARHAKHVEPLPCAECGEMRALIAAAGYTRPSRLSGKGDLCEVCAERPKWQGILDDIGDTPGREASQTRYRANKHLGRILRDGRAYHPDSTHGKVGYQFSGCRCETCRAWKSESNAKLKAARKEREAA